MLDERRDPIDHGTKEHLDNYWGRLVLVLIIKGIGSQGDH